LSAIAACKYYQSEELKTCIAKAVEGLLSTQDSNGYIGTYSHSDFFIGNNWNIWCRKYTLWGLIEAWQLLKDPVIIRSAMRFADHLIAEVGPGAVDIVKTGNFYGLPSCSILQPMVMLYNATGEKRYLDYAEYIVGQWSQHPEGLPDILRKGLSGLPVDQWFPHKDPSIWAKGYELTSCVEGLIQLYKVTGKADYLKCAENIHANLVKWERTPVGSVSYDDKFIGAGGLINTVSEVCDAVYWNRLSFELFKVTGEEKYMDEIERTLYNSLLCAFNPTGDWGLRRLRMSSVHIPAHNHFLSHHQCCTDNLPRALFQAAEGVLSTKKKTVCLSLFAEGEGETLLSSGQKLKIKTEGDFLSSQVLKITLISEHPENFPFMIRMPRWSENTQVIINGKNEKSPVFNNWMTINRDWKNGDVIELKFNLNLRWETFNPAKFAGAFHPINYYDSQWAKMGFIKGTDLTNNLRFDHLPELTIKDVLPSRKAVTFFYGPIALARDTRISGNEVFSKINDPENIKPIIQPAISPKGIWKSYTITLGKEQRMRFCDFSSAGNTWDKNSIFNTWCLLNHPLSSPVSEINQERK
jgi:DUF1680 family protein